MVYMLFERHINKTDLNLVLDKTQIPRVSFTKFLGHWIDDKLTWEIHVERLLSKLKSRLGMLYKMNTILWSNLQQSVLWHKNMGPHGGSGSHKETDKTTKLMCQSN